PAPIDATRLGRECSFRSGEAPGRHRIPLFTIGRRTDGGQRAKCGEQRDHNRWPRTGQGLSTEPEVGPARGGQEGTWHLRLHAPSGYLPPRLARRRYLARREDNLPWPFVSEGQVQFTRRAVNYIARCAGETGLAGSGRACCATVAATTWPTRAPTCAR